MGNEPLVIESERMTIEVKDCIEWQCVIAKLNALAAALDDFGKGLITDTLSDCSISLQNLYYKYVENDGNE